MTLPTILPAPPEMVQEPARCWSTAFDSWHQAVSTSIDTPSTITDQQLQEWFDGGDGLTTERGSATENGQRMLQGIGMMKVRRRGGDRITRANIARILEREGHIYCAYFWGRLGHACVIYGATEDGFLVMDPARGRGLVTYPRNHFHSRRRVWLGTSQLASLSQMLGNSLQGLRDSASSGPPASEILSQFY